MLRAGTEKVLLTREVWSAYGHTDVSVNDIRSLLSNTVYCYFFSPWQYGTSGTEV